MASPESVTILSYDPATGQVSSRTRTESLRNSSLPRHVDGELPASVSPEEYSPVAGVETSGRERIDDTRPYPWSAVVHVEADVSGTDKTQQCSGVMIDDNHVLTAGHCTYLHGNGGWAEGVTVSPGRNLQAVFDHPNSRFSGASLPFGQAQVTEIQTYQRWTDDRHRGFDMAVLTLDREVGTYTGTYGLAAYPDNNDAYEQKAHATGYPTNPPEDPVLTQWDDYDDGNGLNSLAFLADNGCLNTGYCHAVSMTVSSGQSGGPIWRSGTTSSAHTRPYVISVASAGFEFGSTPISQLPVTGTRLTVGKFDDVEAMVARGHTVDSTTNKPDLEPAGSRFHGQSDRQVTATETTFSVSDAVLNRGTAATDCFTVTYRIVKDGAGETTTLGTDEVCDVEPFRALKATSWTGTFPQVEAGQYEIEAVIDSNDDVDEFDESNQIIDSGEVTVTATGVDNTILDTRGELTTSDPTTSDEYYDEYTFSGSEGERITFEVRPDKSHENDPDLTLYQPDGDEAEYGFNTREGDEVLTAILKESGTYTIRVESGSHDDTFGYQLFGYRSLPVDIATGYGARIDGTLTRTDRYSAFFGNRDSTYDVISFEGTAGDRLTADVRAAEPHEHDVSLTLYQPDGDQALETDDYRGGAIVSRRTLQETGEYKLVVKTDSPYEAARTEYRLDLYEGLPADETLAYGSQTSDSLNVSDRYLDDEIRGLHDVYAFSGREGDVVSVDLRPNKSHENLGRLQLFDPDGDEVVDTRRSGYQRGAAITRQRLTETGEYKLVVSGDTADYDLSLAEGFPAGEEIPYGNVTTNRLDRSDHYLSDEFDGFSDAYTFRAEGGERVNVEMRPRAPDDYDGELFLFGPNGNELAQSRSGLDGFATITGRTLPDRDGTYTIVATSERDDDQFAYDLALYADLPAEGAIGYGESRRGRVDRGDRYLEGRIDGFYDAYTLTGTKGEVVTADLRPTDTFPNEGQLVIYGPDGSEFAYSYGDGVDDGALVQSETLPSNGTYRIAVTGTRRSDTFGYELRLYEELAVDARLTDGETVARELDRSDRFLNENPFDDGFAEVLAFEGTEGEVVNVELKPNGSSETQAELLMLQPDGDVADRGRYGSDDDEDVAIRHRLKESGTYALVVADESRTGTYPYELTYYTDLPVDASLLYGESHAGLVTTDDNYLDDDEFEGYHDIVSFEGVRGETVSLTLRSERPSDVDPRVTVLEPDGDRLDFDEGYSDNPASLSELTLDESGRHLVIVGAQYDTTTFQYDLTLDGPDNNPPRAAASADPTTVAVGNVVTLDASGSVDPDGDRLSYRWTQELGPSVRVDGANTARASFTAPATSDGTVMQFEVAARDGEGKADTETVAVTVVNETDRPVISLSPDTGPAGRITTVDLTLSEAPDGLSGYTITAEVLNDSVARITDGAAASAFRVENVSVDSDGTTARLSAADFDEQVGPGATDVTLGTLNLSGVGPGETRIALRVTRLNDDRGGSIDTGVRSAAFDVESIDAVVGTSPPTDADGDGRYEDVNGNQRADFDDAVELFVHLSRNDREVLDHVSAYDFNGNGQLDFDDAVELFRLVTDRVGGTDTATSAVSTSQAFEPTATDGPQVRLTDVTAQPGETTTADVVLSAAPDGVAGYHVSVSVANGSVGSVTDVSVSSATRPNVSVVEANGTDVELLAADFDRQVEPGATDVRLAQLTFEGSRLGETTATVTVDRIDDDDGDIVDASGDTARVRVTDREQPTVDARFTAPSATVDAPTDVAVEATAPTGTIANVTLRTPDGERIVAEHDGDRWVESVIFTDSTWDDASGSYGTTTVTVRVTTESGVSVTTTVETPVYIAGDANGDGAVNILDAVAVGRAWQTERDDPGYSDAADLNNDGVVNILDAVAIGRNWQTEAG